MSPRPFQLIEDNAENITSTTFREAHGRLSTITLSPVIHHLPEQRGIIQIDVERKTWVVLDFSIPGGSITYPPREPKAMGVYLAFRPGDFRSISRTFIINNVAYTWRVYDEPDLLQLTDPEGNFIAQYEPQPDSQSAVLTVVESHRSMLIEIVATHTIVRHYVKFTHRRR